MIARSVKAGGGPARLLALLCVWGWLIGGCAPPQPPAPGEYWPTKGWRASTPEQQGMDSGKLADLLYVIQQESALNLHSLLVIRHGYLVSEVYFTAAYGPKTRHVLYSVTKSFVSTLVGMALDKGYIDNLRHPVLDFFPRRTIENREAWKEAMTLEDLLTMQSGLDWQEGNTAYTGLAQSLDAVKYVLDEPMLEPPGTRFLYCSGCSHVLSGILQEQPGLQTLDFAKKNLFEPLGISDYRWDLDSHGVALGGWGLYLTPRDMAKLGYLYLHNGLWDGRQIVSAAWVKTATETHTDPRHKLGFGYGYQWWTFPRLDAYLALGMAGQIIFVAPGSDLVVVVTADQSDLANEATIKLIEAYILTSVKSSTPLPANPAGQAELAAQIKASQRLRAPSPLLPSAVRATAEQWSVLLMGCFGLSALASKRLYLGGGEMTGWPARGFGLAALTVVVLQMTHHSTCNLLASISLRPDLSAHVLALVAILAGWQVGRASAIRPPAPQEITAAWALLACSVAGGCLLGLALQAPVLFTLPTLPAWIKPLLICLGLTVIALALLRYSNPAPMVVFGPATLTGGLLIGWLFGFLGGAIVNFLKPAASSLTDLAQHGFDPLLASLASLWPGGTTLAEVASHWVVLCLIGFGLWALISQRLYLGRGCQITGWGARGLGLLVVGAALLLSIAPRNTDLGAYLLSQCFGPDLVAYLWSLSLILGGILARHGRAEAARPRLAHLLRANGAYTALGLAAGSLLGVALKDPVLLSGATPWLAVRLGLTALGLAAIPLAAFACPRPTPATVSRVAVLAGGLFLGWMFGYLGEGIVSALWPIHVAFTALGG